MAAAHEQDETLRRTAQASLQGLSGGQVLILYLIAIGAIGRQNEFVGVDKKFPTQDRRIFLCTDQDRLCRFATGLLQPFYPRRQFGPHAFARHQGSLELKFDVLSFVPDRFGRYLRQGRKQIGMAGHQRGGIRRFLLDGVQERWRMPIVQGGGDVGDGDGNLLLEPGFLRGVLATLGDAQLPQARGDFDPGLRYALIDQGNDHDIEFGGEATIKVVDAILSTMARRMDRKGRDHHQFFVPAPSRRRGNERRLG